MLFRSRSGVLVVSQFDLGRVQACSGEGLTGLWVVCGGCSDSSEESGFVLQVAFSSFDGREECGHLIIVLLRPFFIRVVMASCALEALPHEELGEVFRARFGVVHLAEPNDSGVALRITGSGQEFLDDQAHRFVFEEALSQPIMEGVGTIASVFTSVRIAKDCRPLASEVGCIIGRVEKFLDNLGTPFLYSLWSVISGGRK